MFFCLVQLYYFCTGRKVYMNKRIEIIYWTMMTSVRFSMLVIGMLCTATVALALDIPKGTFFFDNSITQYGPVVKFVYGSDQNNVTYVVSMKDEGNNRWSVTINETVHDMYRYIFTATSMEDGVYEQSFSSMKDYISLTLNEYRTITDETSIPVGGIYTPTNNEKWASAVWRMPNEKAYSGTLPVLFINTTQPVDSKENYVDGTYYIDAMGVEGYESVGSADQPLALQIKGRGNYTWSAFDKKPYRLKLTEKARLLGMKNTRHFTLLAHADDNMAFLRNTVGFELSRRLHLAYTPEQRPVELVMNNEYLGLYMLTDKIRVDKKHVDIVEQADLQTDPDSITGGWLIEIDNYVEQGQIRFTEGNGEALRFTCHMPEQLSDVQHQYITDFLTQTDLAIYNPDKSSTQWEEYIDLDTLVRFYIVQEMMDNAESFHGSCYISKDMGEHTKLMFGPVWDFGNAFHRQPGQFIYENSPFGQNWIGEIARYSHFQERVREIWQPFLGDEYPTMDAFIDDFVSQIALAMASDARRWPQYGSSDAEGRKNTFKWYLGKKVDFLRNEWGEGTTDIMAVTHPSRQAWYTLDGRRLNGRPTRKGLYLYGSRKVRL